MATWMENLRAILRMGNYEILQLIEMVNLRVHLNGTVKMVI